MIILLPCAAIAGMWALGKGSLFGGKMKMSKNVDGVKVQNQGDLVIYNGHKYQYNKDITSILFMGVDRDKINTDEEYLKKHGAGQSDTLFLAAVNTSTGKISLINVPRDIMANVRHMMRMESIQEGTSTVMFSLCLWGWESQEL